MSKGSSNKKRPNKTLRYRCVIEEAVGETRAAVYAGRKLVELYTRRWSDATMPRVGDEFCGAIRDVDKDLGAAFVDLGSGVDGFLKFTMAPKAPRFQNGQRVRVSVAREAETGKGPILKFIDMMPEGKVGRLTGHDLEGYISALYPNVQFDKAAVNAIDDATSREIAMSAGGDIAIDFTRALTAIDIDKGRAQSGYVVCQAAIPLIASQVRLRGLGGLFVVDFPNLRQPRQRESLHKLMQEAFSDDPMNVKVGHISRFGTLEFTRAKQGRSLDEVMNDRFGQPTVETQALYALRRLEREGRTHAGAKLILHAPQDVLNWLQDDKIEWRTAMTDRLGARFNLKLGADIDVEVDR